MLIAEGPVPKKPELTVLTYLQEKTKAEEQLKREELEFKKDELQLRKEQFELEKEERKQRLQNENNEKKMFMEVLSKCINK